MPRPTKPPRNGLCPTHIVGSANVFEMTATAFKSVLPHTFFVCLVILSPLLMRHFLECVARPRPPLQMYKNSQLSLENINADKEIKTKVRPLEVRLLNVTVTPKRRAADCGAAGQAGPPLTLSSTALPLPSDLTTQRSLYVLGGPHCLPSMPRPLPPPTQRTAPLKTKKDFVFYAFRVKREEHPDVGGALTARVGTGVSVWKERRGRWFQHLYVSQERSEHTVHSPRSCFSTCISSRRSDRQKSQSACG